MPWFVYIAQSQRSVSVYTGMTSNPVRRLQQHNDGTGAKFTRGRGPWEIVYLEEVPDKSSALRREREIKSLSRAQKLELVNRQKAQGQKDPAAQPSLELPE